MVRGIAACLLWATPAVALAADGTGVGALSLLAPLVAILLAVATRRVIPSLATGVVIAGLVSVGGRPLAAANVLWGYLWGAASDGDHLKITAFTVLVAAMVGLLTQSGAMRGMVARLQTTARSPRGARVASWLGGVIVFFDDYANCLVVGKAMGPLCDRFRVSRAKLAYIVDATAAPVATLAIVSTWVGFQVDEIEGALAIIAETDPALVAAGSGVTAFSLFLFSLPYAFYSWLTIVFVGSIALSGRDFGPMWQAENEAWTRPAVLDEDEAVLGPASLAVLPIVALVAITFALLLWTGQQELGAAAADAALFEIVGAARAYDSMLYGAAAAFVIAVVMSLVQGALKAPDVPTAAWSGVRPVLDALLVLLLAWTLGDAIKSTGAAQYIAMVLDGQLPVGMLPAVTFLLAGAIAFATGSSYSTMIILIPLAIPLSITTAGDAFHPAVLGSTAAILGGSVLGDHASPISDTTVLSALGSEVDLITHVRTQLPYALVTGAIALFFGYLPAGHGVNPWLCVAMGSVACVGVVRFAGSLQPAEVTSPAPAASGHS